MATRGDHADEKKTVGDALMARRPKMKNNMPVRVADEAIRIARIAAGFTTESMAEYISRIVCERGREDIDRFYEKLKGEKPPEETAASPPPAAEKVPLTTAQESGRIAAQKPGKVRNPRADA